MMSKKTLIVLAWLGLIAGFFLLGGNRWLQLETILEYRDQLKVMAETHQTALAIGFALIYTLATALSIPGASILSLVAGFLFGRWLGTVVIVVSATAGAVLVFWLSRYLFADWVRIKLRNSGQAQRLIQGFHADAFNYLLFLRLAPVFPFWLVNIAPAFTPVSTTTYTFATLIGIIPGSFVFANLGETLGNIDRLDQLVTTEVMVALGLLGLLALAPVIVKRYLGGFRADHT